MGNGLGAKVGLGLGLGEGDGSGDSGSGSGDGSGLGEGDDLGLKGSLKASSEVRLILPASSKVVGGICDSAAFMNSAHI